MNFPSNILSIFNLHAGTQNPLDGVIDVPRVLQPTVVIPELMNELNAVGSSTAIQRTSFMVSNTQTQTNGAGGSVAVVNVGQGLWDLDVQFHIVANYTDVLAANVITVRVIGAPVAQTFDLFRYYAQTNTFGAGRRFLISIPATVSSYQISIGFPANAAGQTLTAFVSVVGNRLG